MRLHKKLQGKEWWLALAVMSVGLLVTLASTFLVYSKKTERNQTDFQQLSLQIEHEVAHRLEANLRVLAETRGLLIASGGHITQQTLQRFQSQRSLAEEFPALITTGFIRRIPARQMANYLAQRQNDPLFLLKGADAGPADHHVVEIAEPHSLGKHLIGLDLASDPKLKLLLDRSVRDGSIAVLGPFELNGVASSGGNLIAVLPYFREGAPLSTADERLKALEGWVFSISQMSRLMQNVSSEPDRQLQVELFAGNTQNRSASLFKSGQLQAQEFHHASTLNIGGVKFTLAIAADRTFSPFYRESFPPLTLLTGLLLTLLLGWSVWTAGHTRRMALFLAEKMSAAACNREAQLEAIFNNTAESIITVDQYGAIHSFNRAAQQLFGYSSEEVLGRNVGILTPDLTNFDEARVRELLRNAREKTQSHQIEGLLMDRNGRKFMAEISIGECMAGKELLFVVILRDISWRRQQEREKAEIQYRLTLALDAAGLGVWQWWPETDQFRADDKTCFLYGIGVSEFSHAIGQWLGFVHEDDRGRVMSALQETLHQRERHSVQFRIRQASGLICHQLIHMRVTQDPAGRKNLIGVVQDVTAQKLLEQSLRTSEERFALAAQAAQEGIWDWDLISGQMWFSEQWKAMLGYKEFELENTLAMWEALILPEDRERALQLIDTFARGFVAHFEDVFRFRHKAGHVAHVRYRAVQQNGPAGEVIRIVGTATDITDALRQETELRESRERLALTIDCAGLGIWDWNMQSNLVVYGGKWGEMLGYSLDEINQNAQSWQILIHPDDYARTMAAHEAHWRGDTTVYSSEYRMRTKQGGWRWVLGVGRVISYAENGRPQRMLGVNVDIDERKRNEQALLEAREAAEEASRAKSQFLANMSHEIRTPLNAVLGFSSLLAETVLDSRQADFVDSIHTAGDALLAQINDLLDFSKIEAGRLELEDIEFDLRGTLEQTLNIVAAKAAAKKVELACLVAPDTPLSVIGDPGRLRQILLNMLNNAVKFTNQGEVAARARIVGEDGDLLRLRVEVHDTGIGISPEIQARLFEPFTQADASTTREFGGTGLGLSICRRLVEAMRGKLGLQSAPGQGAMFWFEVPLRKAPAYCEVSGLPLAYLGGKVLIVESSSLYREALSMQLESIGLASTCCQSSTQALAQLSDNPEDFLLLIVDQQTLEGCDDAQTFVRTLRESTRFASLPLIRLNALLDVEPASALHGISLSKPVSLIHLRHSIREALNLAPRPATPQYFSLMNDNPAGASDTSPRVLLAEDNLVNQKLAMVMLQSLGCQVDVANNGEEAVNALEKQGYDLVLMDCQMPRMDGFTATAQIRAMPGARGSVPIVALTANAFKADAERCMTAGMSDFLSKPFSRESLFGVLVRWLPGLVPEIEVEHAFETTRKSGNATNVDELQEDLNSIEDTFAELEKSIGLDMREEMLDLYFPTQAECLETLQAALLEGECAIVQSVAHKLKGASVQLGARILAAHCLTMEHAGRDGLIEEARAAFPALQWLAEQLAQRLRRK